MKNSTVFNVRSVPWKLEDPQEHGKGASPIDLNSLPWAPGMRLGGPPSLPSGPGLKSVPANQKEAPNSHLMLLEDLGATLPNALIIWKSRKMSSIPRKSFCQLINPINGPKNIAAFYFSYRINFLFRVNLGRAKSCPSSQLSLPLPFPWQPGCLPLF